MIEDKSCTSGKKNSRDMVLELLELNRGSYLSGEEIALAVGISRTAVWKAVNKLRSEGYSIDAVTNRGYALVISGDTLSEDRIRRYMKPSSDAEDAAPWELEIEVFDKVDSTNSVCMRRAAHRLGQDHMSRPGPGKGRSPGRIDASGHGYDAYGRRHGYDAYAAIAGCQTQGRGRRGRSFFSPGGTGLYMSILLRPAGLAPEQAMSLTTIAAVAAAEAIETVSHRTAAIKWVNDIYVGGRKVCGILTEASFNPEDGALDYAVVGIGINVYEPVGGFPEDIRDLAGAIASSAHVTGAQSETCTSESLIENGGRNRLAAEILTRFFGYLDDMISSADMLPAYVNEYRSRCFVTGMDIDVLKVRSKPLRARVIGVDDQCRLIVRYMDGSEETLRSGEISIRI